MKKIISLLTTLVILISPTLVHAKSKKFVTSGTGGICNRNVDIQKALLDALKEKDCSIVTKDDLASITGIWINYGFNDLFEADPRCVQHCKIETLTYKELQGLTGIKEFVIEFSDLNYISDDAFKDFYFIETLDISHNQLPNVSENLLKGLTTLKSFELDSNEAFIAKTLPEKLFFGLCNLESVDLDSLGLETLPEKLFFWPCNKKELSTSVPPRYLNIKEIDLDNNNIAQLPLGIFKYLNPKVINEIDLTFNPITKEDLRAETFYLPKGVVETGEPTKDTIFNFFTGQ